MSTLDQHTETPSQAVVRAVAEAADVDQLDLPPLFHAIDPDALDALFATDDRADERRTAGSVTFHYYGYEVSVSARGTVHVDEFTEL